MWQLTTNGVFGIGLGCGRDWVFAPAPVSMESPGMSGWGWSPGHRASAWASSRGIPGARRRARLPRNPLLRSNMPAKKAAAPKAAAKPKAVKKAKAAPKKKAKKAAPKKAKKAAKPKKA